MTGYDGFAFRKAIRFTLLSTGAVAVAHDLATYADNDTGKCFPTQEQLAQGTGLSVRSVRRVLTELKDAGLIHVEKNKARDFNANSIYWCRVPVRMQSKLKAEIGQREKSTRAPASAPAGQPPSPPVAPPPELAPAVAAPVTHPRVSTPPVTAFPVEPVWRRDQ